MRRVLLPAPRSFCAGVERAIEVVERLLERHGPPVYVRNQIVHNAHVVGDLESRGAVFVSELDAVPEGRWWCSRPTGSPRRSRTRRGGAASTRWTRPVRW
ncbi:hypothetical protein GCM10029992_63480 [Glycomyces albus]